MCSIVQRNNVPRVRRGRVCFFPFQINNMSMHFAQDDFTGAWTIAMFNNRLGIFFSINRWLNR